MPDTENIKQQNRLRIGLLESYLRDLSNGLTDNERGILAERISLFTDANEGIDDQTSDSVREDITLRIKREQSRIFRLCKGVRKQEQEEKDRLERQRIERERKYYEDQRKEEERRKEIDQLRIDGIELKKQLELHRKEQEELQAREEAERKAREEKEKAEQERHIAEVTSTDLPMDWSNAFDEDERAQTAHAETSSDGLILSLTTLGRVDIEFIAAVTGKTLPEVIKELEGSIYQNPEKWGEVFYKGWEQSEEYLSGNLSRKLRTARAANEKYRGYFAANIAAIEKVLPPSAASGEIYATLGSPWLPTDVIDEFIIHLLGYPPGGYSKEQLAVKHDERTGTWEIPHRMRYSHRVKATRTWGTMSMSALYILEDTLNMTPVRVTRETRSSRSKRGVKRVLDKDATLAALEKQRRMIDEFRSWVWKDPDRAKRLTEIFEDKYGCVRRRVFDGSFLEFPGMSEKVSLYPYQKDAVARIIFSPNTLLAHDVGAGKTYEMIAAGQELRRMGLSEKNMYVVPNNIVGQWRDIFLEMYPQAKLLCVEPKSFTPDKRVKVLESVRDDSYDGIIIAYSCFEMIPVSREYLIREIDEKIRELDEIVNGSNGRRGALRGIGRRQESLSKQREKLEATAVSGLPCFDELGVTRLFLDEAHNYKNVPINTKTGNMPGISRTGSKKCHDMLTKVHMVQRNNNGGGVVFATGTPITNSITDAFIMQKYLQEGELRLLDLDNFDGWVGMFAEKNTEFEIDVDTSSFRLATRFSKFHNLPELTMLLSSIADFHSVGASDGLPSVVDGRIDVTSERSAELSDYLSEISMRADTVRQGAVDPHEDNLLKITTDGRKAALDIRLVRPDTVFSAGCKAEKCARKAADIYFSTEKDKLTQLIFCDTSTPKAGFNIYDELRSLLIWYGVSAEDIAYIHDAATESKREKLFERMRNGEIRILIGSTFKLGLGVNIQNRLIALHHIDVPWRPADMTQREGRIIRRGNINSEVFIYRYVTEGSFDAYSWQLLETKQRFITDLLSGSVGQRSGGDINDIALDYAEVKALAIGDPRLKQRVIAANELARYRMLQKNCVETRLALERELAEMPAKRTQYTKNLENSIDDRDFYLDWKRRQPQPVTAAEKNAEASRRKEQRELLGAALDGNEYAKEDTVLMTYRGFRIVLPANMRADHPHVWLERAGRHYVELRSLCVVFCVPKFNMIILSKS